MSASNTHWHDTSTLLLKISSLQAELSHLQHRYDALLAAKERAAERYKADYKKWLCESSDCRKEVHPLLDGNYDIYRRASRIDKRYKFEEIGADLSARRSRRPRRVRTQAFTRLYAQLMLH